MNLTPVETRAGHTYKRDDLHRHPTGVNGGKWRQCQWLVARAAAEGHTHIITGASVLSPQLPMTAVAAVDAGLTPTIVIGGTTPEKAYRHPGVRLAVDYGAEVEAIRVGYNPALQSYVRRAATERAWATLNYGVAPPPDADPDTLTGFHDLGAHQARNLPPTITRVILPFGSGNTAASVLWGLTQNPQNVTDIHLIGIGPNKSEYLHRRLDQLGVTEYPWRIHHHDLHGAGLVTYGKPQPHTSDGITLHPTYEGKIATWLNNTPQAIPAWTDRDPTCLFWIVGGPL